MQNGGGSFGIGARDWEGLGVSLGGMILVFLSIVAAVNYYLYCTVVAAYPEFWLIALLALVILVGSLFAAMGLERKGFLRASIPFSWLGYTWLGAMGIGLFLAAVFDALQLFVPEVSDAVALHWAGALTGVASIWGFVSARRVRVKRVTIGSDRVPDIGRPIVLVQISDMHLGDGSALSRTKKVADTVNELRPDIVVSTGDLFDGFLPMMGPYVEVLKSIRATEGAFAVSGNHEVYAGLEEAMTLTEAAGFCNLRNRLVILNSGIALVGVEDPASPDQADEPRLLGAVDAKRFTVLLKHRPDIEEKSIGKFDLQLSGHTHGGQIFPFHLLAKLIYRAHVGLSVVGSRQFLYLSRGTGSWGPQMRLLAPPEITCFELIHGRHQG